MLEAEVSAGLGDASGAEALFRELLAIDPHAELRAGRAPKVIQPFEAARSFIAGRTALRIHAQATAGAVTVVVDADLLGIVGGAEVRYATPQATMATSRASGADAIIVALPPGGSPVVAAVLDSFGNRLIEVPVVAAAAAPPQANVAATPRRHGLLGRWQLWAGISLGTGVAAAVFAIDFSNTRDRLDDVVANSANHDYGEYQALDRRQTRDAVLADIGFAVAAATAITSTVLYIRGRSDIVVAPVASSSTAGAAFHMSF